jgi:hypothetical protein
VRRVLSSTESDWVSNGNILSLEDLDSFGKKYGGRQDAMFGLGDESVNFVSKTYSRQAHARNFFTQSWLIDPASFPLLGIGFGDNINEALGNSETGHRFRNQIVFMNSLNGLLPVFEHSKWSKAVPEGARTKQKTIKDPLSGMTLEDLQNKPFGKMPSSLGHSQMLTGFASTIAKEGDWYNLSRLKDFSVFCTPSWTQKTDKSLSVIEETLTKGYIPSSPFIVMAPPFHRDAGDSFEPPVDDGMHPSQFTQAHYDNNRAGLLPSYNSTWARQVAMFGKGYNNEHGIRDYAYEYYKMNNQKGVGLAAQGSPSRAQVMGGGDDLLVRRYEGGGTVQRNTKNSLGKDFRATPPCYEAEMRGRGIQPGDHFEYDWTQYYGSPRVAEYEFPDRAVNYLHGPITDVLESIGQMARYGLNVPGLMALDPNGLGATSNYCSQDTRKPLEKWTDRPLRWAGWSSSGWRLPAREEGFEESDVSREFYYKRGRRSLTWVHSKLNALPPIYCFARILSEGGDEFEASRSRNYNHGFDILNYREDYNTWWRRKEGAPDDLPDHISNLDYLNDLAFNQGVISQNYEALTPMAGQLAEDIVAEGHPEGVLANEFGYIDDNIWKASLYYTKNVRYSIDGFDADGCPEIYLRDYSERLNPENSGWERLPSSTGSEYAGWPMNGHITANWRKQSEEGFKSWPDYDAFDTVNDGFAQEGPSAPTESQPYGLSLGYKPNPVNGSSMQEFPKDMNTEGLRFGSTIKSPFKVGIPGKSSEGYLGKFSLGDKVAVIEEGEVVPGEYTHRVTGEPLTAGTYGSVQGHWEWLVLVASLLWGENEYEPKVSDGGRHCAFIVSITDNDEMSTSPALPAGGSEALFKMVECPRVLPFGGGGKHVLFNPNVEFDHPDALIEAQSEEDLKAYVINIAKTEELMAFSWYDHKTRKWIAGKNWLWENYNVESCQFDSQAEAEAYSAEALGYTDDDLVQREVVVSDGSAFSLEGLAWDHNLHLEHSNAIDWIGVEPDDVDQQAIGAQTRWAEKESEPGSREIDTDNSRFFRDVKQWQDLRSGYPIAHQPHYSLDWKGRKWVTYTIGGRQHGQCMARMNRITQEWYNSMEAKFPEAVQVPSGELYLSVLSAASFSSAWAPLGDIDLS